MSLMNWAEFLTSSADTHSLACRSASDGHRRILCMGRAVLKDVLGIFHSHLTWTAGDKRSGKVYKVWCLHPCRITHAIAHTHTQTHRHRHRHTHAHTHTHTHARARARAEREREIINMYRDDENALVLKVQVNGPLSRSEGKGQFPRNIHEARSTR